METTQQQKAQTFADLHSAGRVFVMPNAWNAGSAWLLAEAGFDAIATTSAGIAYSLALPDWTGALELEPALQETGRIARAVALPVNMDAENGYGHEPAEVAATISMIAATGAVGAGIEDYSGDAERGMYERTLATERIRAARLAADGLGFRFTLTARTECYLVDHAESLTESIERLNLYRAAGADCVYAPGIRDADDIAILVREVDAPVNVVMGLVGVALTVAELEQLGVKRISIGGSLARATLQLVRDAAAEIRDHGTFVFAQHQIPDAELIRAFSDRIKDA